MNTHSPTRSAPPVPCVAVYSPAGTAVRVFEQSSEVTPDQEVRLLADAWHDDKPADDPSACTTPKDADIARAKGYRIAHGLFHPNDGGGDLPAAIHILRQILHDLPAKRDWLSPDLEKAARSLTAAHKIAVSSSFSTLAQPVKHPSDLAPLKPGDAVWLVPTQGGHQKAKPAVFVSATATEWRARAADRPYVMRFRKTDSLPVLRRDQEFPCYRLQFSEPAS